MTEITRVPLQPIKRGSLTKLWLGVFAALLLAAVLAFKGGVGFGDVAVETLKAGAGPKPTTEDVVLVNYVGRLQNGKEFDRGDRVPFPVTGVVPGFSKALQQMQKGGKYRVVIPSRLAYGSQDQRNPETGEVVIPGNSDLVFEVDLIDFKNRAEIEAQQRMLQQLQQHMRGGAGGPGGAPGGPPSGQ